MSFRFDQMLKPLDGEIKKHSFGAFDVETFGKSNEFLLGGYYDEGGYRSFTNKEDYAEFLVDRNKRNRWMCATNLGFDHTTIFHDSEYWAHFDLLIRAGSIITATYRKNPRNPIKFVDTMNYAKLSVEQIGKLIGIEKVEKPDFLGKKPKTKQEWDILNHYCEYDCRITYYYMRYLQEEFNRYGCELKITIGSSAMDLFKRKYLAHTIIRDEAILEGSNDIANESYFGGRVEAFKRGKITPDLNLKVYDINSMYPYVMLKESYPYPESVFKPQYLSLDFIDRYEGVSKVRVTYEPDRLSPELKRYANYPLLPVRHNGRLVFPTGKFVGYYTHVELRRALELGYRLEPLEHLCYKKVFEPFISYVEDMYHRKKNAKSDAEKHTAKLFLNSLYGKFGTRTFTETEFYDTKCMTENEQNEFYQEYFNPENEVYGEATSSGYIQRNTDAQAGYVLPIIASYVTAYARILLHHYLIRYEPYYCDTDSIITNAEIETSKELGFLKIEEEIENGYIVRAKFYRTDKRVKLKGVPKRIISEGELRVLDQDSFDEIVKTGRVVFQRFSKLRESYKQGLSINTIKTVEKVFDMNDQKRAWLEEFSPDKMVDSKPLNLDEDAYIRRGEKPLSNITFRKDK